MSKGPVKVGDLYEAVGSPSRPSGKGYEVAEQLDDDRWLLRRVGGSGSLKRTTKELHDPFKWQAFGLDELPPEQRADTIQGKAAAVPPTSGDEPAPAGPEYTVEASVVVAGFEVFSPAAEAWVLVNRVEQLDGGKVGFHTADGVRSVSFFSRVRTRRPS